MRSDAFNILNQYPDDFQFELIIYDFTGGPCLLAFMHKFKYPPLIAVTALAFPAISFMCGDQYFSYVPHGSLPFSDNMTFWQRAYNLAVHVEGYL